MVISAREDLLAADIREVIPALEATGDLERVDGAHWNLEIGAITELVALQDGPALLFDSIKDYRPGYRVLSNVTNSPRRIGTLLGQPEGVHGIELVRAIQKRFGAIQPLEPVEVAHAPFREVEERGADINLWKFPTPFWHEEDGGRYLGTACAVITRDPDEGWVNLGTYRVQVHEDRLLGLFIQPSHHGSMMLRKHWERGEAGPVAVCIGVQPSVLMGAFIGLPWGMSEIDWAGGLAGQPVGIVRGEVTGLPIPASAEIVIEGFCPPPSEETRVEGPFGETLGYYASGARPEPVIRVELVQHRENPILVGAPPLRPPASSSATYLFRSASLWTELERVGIPGVRGVWMNPAGSSTLLAIVAMRQAYAGHARQVAQAVLASRVGRDGRLVVIVDDDVDPSDTEQVLWAITTRCDPETALDVVVNCNASRLDPCLPPEKRAAHDYTTSRGVIYACRPYRWFKQFPKPVGTSPELREQILRDWPQLFAARPR
jgi:4-hydroxy-3-polyprenylbenzoate decarboxylase